MPLPDLGSTLAMPFLGPLHDLRSVLSMPLHDLGSVLFMPSFWHVHDLRSVLFMPCFGPLHDQRSVLSMPCFSTLQYQCSVLSMQRCMPFYALFSLRSVHRHISCTSCL